MTQGTDLPKKTLYLLRHAQSPSQAGISDKDRVLSPKGLEDAAALGREMKKLGFTPDFVLCSPATRTRQTFESLKLDLASNKIEKPEIIYRGIKGDYFNLIQNLDNSYNAVLLVAHNPSIYELVIMLAGHGADHHFQRLSEGYHPATLSVLDCPCENWAEIQPSENTLRMIINPLDYNAPARPTRWM